MNKAEWVEDRNADLLPVEYFHVVFTIAAELRGLFLYNQAIAYALLFKAAAESLLELAANPKRLGASIGFTAVLHTWTQTLTYHPHVHCIVPGGGPSLKGDEWISSRKEFLVPLRPLSMLFRGKLISFLRKALVNGKLKRPPDTNVRRALRAARKKKWHVYAKPALKSPESIVDYLARYAHRIAISNERIVSHENGKVTFQYRDQERSEEVRLMTLPAEQFLRRFLLHVLPSRFMRIRYYGGMAHPIRVGWLAKCRALLAQAGVAIPPPQEKPENESWEARLLRLTGVDVTRCPRCKSGRLLVVEELPRDRAARVDFIRPVPG